MSKRIIWKTAEKKQRGNSMMSGTKISLKWFSIALIALIFSHTLPIALILRSWLTCVWHFVYFATKKLTIFPLNFSLF